MEKQKAELLEKLQQIQKETGQKQTKAEDLPEDPEQAIGVMKKYVEELKKEIEEVKNQNSLQEKTRMYEEEYRRQFAEIKEKYPYITPEMKNLIAVEALRVISTNPEVDVNLVDIADKLLNVVRKQVIKQVEHKRKNQTRKTSSPTNTGTPSPTSKDKDENLSIDERWKIAIAKYGGKK